MEYPSPNERELQALADDGLELDDLLSDNAVATPLPSGRLVLRSSDEGATIEVEASSLLRCVSLVAPFGKILAKRSGEIGRASLVVEAGRLMTFFDFLIERRSASLTLEQFDNGLFEGFRDWLNTLRTPEVAGKHNPYSSSKRDGGTPLSRDYKRELMNTPLAYLKRLRLDEDYCTDVPEGLDLFREQDWKTPGRWKPTSILTRPELKLLVRLCREEVVATTERLEEAWAFMDDPKRAEHPDAEALTELLRLNELLNGLPYAGHDKLRRIVRTEPGQEKVELFGRKTAPILWNMHHEKYRAMLDLLYPKPRTLLPFLLLFAIYFRYNASVLTKASFKDFSEQPSAYGSRISGNPFKDRSGRQQFASWPISDAAHNPKRMLKTIARWTAGIRPHALPEERDDIFMHRNQTKAVRSFRAIGSIKTALGVFLRDYSTVLPNRFQFRSLRPSVIDLVHHLFDGDVVMAQHAGQHIKVDTTMEHYLFDGARKRNDEALVGPLHGMNAWIETKGVLDPRTDRYEGGGAATPGWKCADPYNGSMIAESGTVPCRAYGRCVICENGTPDVETPTGLGFNVRLREAILRARNTMPEHAWLERWMPVLDVLEVEVLAPAVAADREYLDLPELPTVE
jgi:hypothetical protein